METGIHQIGLRKQAFCRWLFRGLLATILCGLIAHGTEAQCPTPGDFRQKILTMYRPSHHDEAKQLQGLLSLQNEMLTCGYGADSVFMFLLQKTSSLYFAQQKTDIALLYARAAFTLARLFYLQGNCTAEALLDCAYNVAYFAEAAGNTALELRAADSCISYFLVSNRGYDKALAMLGVKIDHLFNKGEYELTSLYCRMGDRIVQRYYRNSDSLRYTLYLAVKEANALYSGGENAALKDKMLGYIKRFQHSGEPQLTGPLLAMLGLVYRDEGDDSLAFEYFNNAYEMDTRASFDEGRAQDLAMMGSLLAKRPGRTATGLTYCRRALQYAGNDNLLFVYKTMANLFVADGRYDSARYYFRKAYATVSPGMDESSMLKDSFQYPDFNQLQYLFDLTTDKGNALVAEAVAGGDKKKLTEAMLVYRKNDQFLQKVMQEQELQMSSELLWMNAARTFYERAVHAACLANSAEDAFYFMERSRATLLNSQIRQQRVKTDAEIEYEISLKNSIRRLDAALANERASSAEYLGLQRKLFDDVSQLEKISTQIRARAGHRNGFFARDSDQAFLTLNRLKAEITDAHTSFIELFAGDSAVYLFVASQNTQSITKADVQAFSHLAGEFNSYLSDAGRLNSHLADYRSVAASLYDMLFQKSGPPRERVIVSPDGIHFPFEALWVNRGGNADYFLRFHSVSYAYSASFLSTARLPKNVDRLSLLGIAPVQFNDSLRLPALPGSARAIEATKKLFLNTKTLVSDAATVGNFLHEFPSYGILDLNTHAVADEDSAGPVIYFRDAGLHLSALMPERTLSTRLVVLSACHTASGKWHRGEGVFSFSRAFAALGVPAVVSNLWAVEDISTYRITDLFYKYLARGLPLDIALQRAKLDFIDKSNSQEKTLPYFWAAPILTGPTDGLTSPKTNHWRFYSGAAIVGILAVFFRLKRKSHRTPVPDH